MTAEHPRRILTLVLALACLAMGCSSAEEERQRNIDYMENTIGRIILDFRKTTNTLPKTFSEALSASGQTLAHRGDVDGQPFTYRLLDPSRFHLHCQGANHEQTTDDLTLIWSEESGWSVIDGPPTE